MTPGQVLLLQQIHLVAHARGWSIPKTIKKTMEVVTLMQSAYAHSQDPAKPVALPATDTMTQKEAKLIAQAEAILKDLEHPTPPTPPAAE